MATKRLMLYDGLAMAYRAFFGVKGLSTAGGQPTNAVYGFIRMLGQLNELAGPTHRAVVFDGGLPTARLEQLAEYKAQRAPMPDDLRSQIPLIEEYLDCAGIAWARVDGEEADDVMASTARWAVGEGEDVVLATNDKDMFQLVGERVRMLLPGKAEWLDREGVLARTGVYPEQITAWLALVGDSADNISGVPGVGAKTAAKLLAEYGTLAGIWAHVDAVKSEKIRRALLESRGLVERNVALITLREDLASPFQWGGLTIGPGDHARLLAYYRRLEFHSLAREVAEPSLF